MRNLMCILTSSYPVHSFVALVRYLFIFPGIRSFLSEQISQDSIFARDSADKFMKSHCGRLHHQRTSLYGCQTSVDAWYGGEDGIIYMFTTLVSDS